MFALCPDHGPPYNGLPRIIRFTTLESNIVSELDQALNILLVNKELFDQLTEEEQNTVIRTHDKTIIMYRTR